MLKQAPKRLHQWLYEPDETERTASAWSVCFTRIRLPQAFSWGGE